MSSIAGIAVYTQPAWEIRISRRSSGPDPSKITRPVRGASQFSDGENVIDPGPLPLVGPIGVSQLCSARAVQVHVAPVVTVADKVAGSAMQGANSDGSTEYEQAVGLVGDFEPQPAATAAEASTSPAAHRWRLRSATTPGVSKTGSTS
jgi:hypothetical protein